jgi:hypothetical protein
VTSFVYQSPKRWWFVRAKERKQPGADHLLDLLLNHGVQVGEKEMEQCEEHLWRPLSFEVKFREFW